MARIATTDQPPTRHMPPRRTDHGGRGPAPGGCPDSPVGRWAGDVSRASRARGVEWAGREAAGEEAGRISQLTRTRRQNGQVPLQPG
jgi:hypothetical protein